MVKKIVLIIYLISTFSSFIYCQQNFTVTSVVPSLISNDHTAEGILLTLSTGRIIHIFRLDPGQFGNHAGNTGGIVKRYSDDEGQTWSSPDSVYKDQYDDREVNGGILSNGRIVITFRRYNANYLQTIDFDLMYSDDGGATWSQRQVINSVGIASDCQKFLPYVPTLGYMINMNNFNYIETRFSNDGVNWNNIGYTWDYRLSHPFVIDEACFTYTRNGKIIGIIRNDTNAMGANHLQVSSGNYGSTYTQPAHTNFANGFFCPGPLIFYDQNHDDLWSVTTDRRGNCCGFIQNDDKLWIYKSNVDSIFQNPTHWTFVDSILRPYPTFYKFYGYPIVTRKQDGNYLIVFTESYRGPYTERAMFYQFEIRYNSSSISNSMVSSVPDSICIGSASNLNVMNGCLSTGSNWYWYTGSCGGTIIGSGFNFYVSPTVTSNYFVRAEGVSNTTTCLSKLVTVYTNSVNPTSVNSSSQITNCNSPISLNISGGTLGTNANWKWYYGNCGVSYIASGATINVNPSVTTKYYVRAESICNSTSSCLSITIFSYSDLINSTSISATPQSVCPNGTSVLNFSGNYASNNIIWNWYTGFCGGVFFASGNSVSVNPLTTTTYYAGIYDYCTNNLTCLSGTVFVGTNSINADSVTATPALICIGTRVNVSLSGGSLGTDASWYWYSSNCGGIYIGSGININLFPDTNFMNNTYYVRAEGQCNTTSCTSKSVTFFSNSIAPTSAISTPLFICNGNSSTLGLSGGLLGTGANWFWYEGSCGGSYVASGATIIVSPVNSSTYFVRVESPCKVANVCAKTTVIVNTNSSLGLSLYAVSPSICYGSPNTIGINGGILGSQANWFWYSGSCGGNPEGTGNLISVSPINTTLYYARAIGVCNTTNCLSITISVTLTPPEPNNISAYNISIGLSQSSVLSVSDSLPPGTSWNWYVNSCGSVNNISTSSNIVVYPLATTTYYCRSENGNCYSNCKSITIIIPGSLNNPGKIFASSNPVCNGQYSSLSLSGVLNGGNWYWYSSSCGGLLIGTGSNITVSSSLLPNIIFVRQELDSAFSSCSSILLNSVNYSNPAISIVASPQTLCNGSSTSLGIIGGNLGSSTNWYWYSGSCGGNLSGIGNSIIVNPSLTTNYFVRAEGYCNTTVCVSSTVIVNYVSNPATSISSISPICPGSSATLNISGGSLSSDANWFWYSGSCNGNYLISGPSLIVSPSVNSTYYVLASGMCNTTSCESKTIILNSLSNPATSASASNSPICSGSSTTLSVSGGSLGVNANWMWYTISCGGSFLFSGSSHIVNPTNTTTYYVMAQGVCNTTSCVSTTVNVNFISIPAASVSPISPICQGSSVSPIINGGFLGTNANWNWYSGSCNGNYLISGTSPIFSPTITTIYYVQASGLCNTTSCVSITIPIKLLSSKGNYATSISPICQGTSTTLGISGGSLGTSSNWFWYSGSCGGNYLFSGYSPRIIPSLATTYYVMAQGICNTTSCVSTTVSINYLSTPPITIMSLSSICSGSNLSLGIIGGSLGTGAKWNWYSGHCNGTFVASGANTIQNPTVTSTYYISASGVCNSTACVSKTVLVNSQSKPASFISCTSSICQGSSVSPVINGGSLGTGANWNWYTGYCNGYYIISGASPVLYPNITTTYYVSATGLCNFTTCVSKTITVNYLSLPASSLTCYSPICQGSYSYTYVNGDYLGTGANWNWYTGSCNGNYVISGYSPVLYPTITTTYYVSAAGLCNTTACVSKTIIVNYQSSPASSISSISPICQGSSTTLGVNGGSLGTGANWYWYAGHCNGNYITSGCSPTIYPFVTTTYYLSASGICNYTSCVSATIIVNPFSPTFSYITPVPPICSGSSVTPNLGGNSGPGVSYNWYTGSCNGNYLISGFSPVFNPTVTTTYYVLASSLCNSAICLSLTINVNYPSYPANSVLFTSQICLGTSTSLMVNGGKLGTLANWNWYSGSCGGNHIGNDSIINVSPDSTTNYFVRAEGNCNTTSCISVNILVNDSSTSASSVNATFTTICSGNSSTLGLNGGLLGTSANWYWYLGNCGTIGGIVGTGKYLTVSPSETTVYFVRSEGICNTTVCLSINIVVNDTSSSASYIISGKTAICTGTSTYLEVSGGLTGSSSNWYWYSGYCGFKPEGSGSSINISPSSTTTYYVRAEGFCNTTNCTKINISVEDSSNSASSITTAMATICSGNYTTLGITGGLSGASANWIWYSGNCGGFYQGIGSTISVNPSETTVYFVRAEGTCNTTSCLSINIYVEDSSITTSSVTATLTTICIGNYTTLGITGGLLGTSANWYWYVDNCNGIFIGSGSSVEVNPSLTTDYFIRAEGPCNTTDCSKIMISVIDTSVMANSVTSTLTTICAGDSSTMRITGGLLGTSADWYWYSGNCGGNPEGIGVSINVNPSITTDYFVRAENICNTTGCISKIIEVISPPIQNSQLNGTINPLYGSLQIYKVINDTNVLSYIWSIPSGWTGTSTSNSITLITGKREGLIVITPVNYCGSGNSETLFVQPVFNISGNFLYDQSNIPLDSVQVNLRLNGSIVDSTISDINGSYLFNNVQNNVYTITAKTNKPWGGVNSTDAVNVKRYYAGDGNISTLLRLHAADVNLSSSINITDAVKIIRRFCGKDSSFQRGDWLFEKPSSDSLSVSYDIGDTVIIAGNNVVQNFKGICVGDVNGSYVPLPGAKYSSKVKLNYIGTKRLKPGEYFELPIMATRDLYLGAISLVLNFPKELAILKDVKLLINSELDNISYNISGNELRIGWYKNENTLKLNNNIPFILIRLKTSNSFKPGDNIEIRIVNNSLSEFANEFGNPFDDITLNTYSIEYSNSNNFINSENKEIRIYPNPAKNLLYIENAENNDIKIFNLLGENTLNYISYSQLFSIDIHCLPEGTYIIKIVSDKSITTKKININK